MKVAPIVMESELKEAVDKINKLVEMEREKMHLDVGDGMFSDLLTVTPADLVETGIENMNADIHLMVDDPVEWIDECSKISPERIIGQIERMGSQEYFLDSVKECEEDIKGGLAVELSTPVESLDPLALERAEVVLLLAVPTGVSGAILDVQVIEKIKELRKVFMGAILVDGGINADNQEKIISAGADEVGANSYFWSELEK